MFNNPVSEDIIVWFVKQSSCLAATLGVTKFIMLSTMNLVTLCLLFKSNLKVQQTNLMSRGWFIEQKFMLSSSFRCSPIHNCHKYDFGHTLLCYLSRTQMFNKPTSEQAEASLLNKSSCSAPTSGVTKFKRFIALNLVKLCCAT